MSKYQSLVVKADKETKEIEADLQRNQIET